MNVVEQHFPAKAKLISCLYSNNDSYGAPKYDQIPVNVLIRGYKICKATGLSDRSIRHARPGQPEINTLVVSKLLDITIRMKSLGYRYYNIKPFQDAARRIEGLHENIRQVFEREHEDCVSRIPEIRDAMHSIIDNGSCRILDDLESELDSIDDDCY